MIVEPWLSGLVSLVPFFSWILIRCDLEKLKRLNKFINPSKLVFRTLFLICFALKTCERHDAGASHYAKISGNFRSKCKWNGLAQVEIFRSKWSASRGGPLGLVGPVGPTENCRSIFRNFRFQFCSSSSLHTVVRMVDGSDVGVYECSVCKLQTQDLNFLLMHSCTQGLGTVVHLDLFFLLGLSVFKDKSIQSGQTANYSSCQKIYIYVSQLFISRMPKMRAIPQLVSAPLNPKPTAEHFRRSHPPCEHSHGQHTIFISEENNAK